MSVEKRSNNDVKNILLGITGSVATIKLQELVKQLREKFNQKVNICILPTKNALNFVDNFSTEFNSHMPDLKDRLKFITAPNADAQSVVLSFTDEDEWSSWSKRNDPVLHIELRKWADLFLIAPLDANTLAKISNGMCDNLLTCVARAWDIENIKTKPIVICPAMNTLMYKHPLTRFQLNILVNQFGFVLVDSIEKVLMCGDVGIGAMANVPDIVNKVASLF